MGFKAILDHLVEVKLFLKSLKHFQRHFILKPFLEKFLCSSFPMQISFLKEGKKDFFLWIFDKNFKFKSWLIFLIEKQFFCSRKFFWGKDNILTPWECFQNERNSETIFSENFFIQITKREIEWKKFFQKFFSSRTLFFFAKTPESLHDCSKPLKGWTL